MKFEIHELPYEYNALEPYIDARTMEIHYSKHHQGYVNNLNAVLEKYPALYEQSEGMVEELLRNFDTVPSDVATVVQNNGGGHANHTLFWACMSPDGGGAPSGDFGKAVSETFGSFESFKEEFSTAAKSRFGSGWAWVVFNGDGIEIMSTANQDSPLLQGLEPLLGLDVWEHAYYLNHQNRRPDYIDAWWNVVNWVQVEKNYAATLQ